MTISYIIIDDRELDCYIAEKMVNNISPLSDIKQYYNAKEALKAIITNKTPNRTIILLDVMMPEMNAFEFIEEFEKLELEITKNYKIIAITTSLNLNEVNKVNSYNSIFKVLKKPVSTDILYSTINQIIFD